MESILNTIKKQLGIDVDDDSFDPDIIVNINSAIFTLSQIGIVPNNGFILSTVDHIWSDYMDVEDPKLESVKMYIYLKTKMIFDPPTNSTTIEMFNKNIQELEWRIMLASETNNLEV